MDPIVPPSVATILEIRSTAVPTNASSASAGRMNMHSYPLNVHLLWSGRPPRRGSRRMRAAQSVRDGGSGSRYGGCGGPSEPVEPVAEHVANGRRVSGASRARDGELVRDGARRERVAPPVERSAREDPETCVAEAEDLRPWLAGRTGHHAPSFVFVLRTVAAGTDRKSVV